MPLLPWDDVGMLTINDILNERHYLGAAKRGSFWYRDEFGVMVAGNPSARYLPQSRWLELSRWCLYGIVNGGSQQWRRVHRLLMETRPELTTVVSYSDPSAGHTGSLYRACNWLWAPTWHRLRPAPSAHGKWSAFGRVEAVKDRWVFCLRPDSERESILSLKDDALCQRFGWAEYRERTGGNYKRWISEGRAA